MRLHNGASIAQYKFNPLAYLNTVERERCEMGFKTWTGAARIAIDRKRWKDTIKSPILQVE